MPNAWAPESPVASRSPRPLTGRQWLVLGFIGSWLAFQILFPLRHLLYPGSPSWTEEGHRFAWQMKLRDKKARAIFIVRDPVTGEEWRVRPREFLLRHQARKVATRPDMVLQFAHHLARVWAEEHGVDDVEVRAHLCLAQWTSGRSVDRSRARLDPDRPKPAPCRLDPAAPATLRTTRTESRPT